MEAESAVLGAILTAKKYQLTPSYIARLARNQTIPARKYGLGVLDDCLSHAFTAVTLARSAGSSKTEDRIKYSMPNSHTDLGGRRRGSLNSGRRSQHNNAKTNSSSQYSRSDAG